MHWFACHCNICHGITWYYMEPHNIASRRIAYQSLASPSNALHCTACHDTAKVSGQKRDRAALEPASDQPRLIDIYI